MDFETLKWIGGINGCLELTDQRALPGKYEKLNCKTIEQLYDAIKTLAVRGAPAIGVSAGYGVVIAAQKMDPAADLSRALAHLEKSIEYLASSRPTAVNLFWALNRMKELAAKLIAKTPAISISDLRKALLDEANAICDEDKQMCKAIGVNGQRFIEEGFAVLTHCNAGALATAGQGTALSPMYEAHSMGRKFKVYADETRPLLQGGRLTTWELKRAGIDITLICDNMAGSLMKQGKINAVITGADRIAANGDAANKIGTYSLSILAAAHDIPFYIAAPSSTFDLSIKTGSDIPIELRNDEEVTKFAAAQVAPDGIGIYNPAFDVTQAENITAIITEKCVIERPCTEKIASHFNT